MKEAPTRLGQSWTASKTHPYQSLAFQGGFVAPNVHFAEMMLKRKLEKDGRTVAMRFWEDEELGQMYQPQLVAARDLLKDHLPEALSAALRAPEGKTVYSLRAPWMAPIYKREDTRIRQEKANLAEKAMGSTAAPPSPPGLQAPRSGFIPTNRSLLSKLKSR